MNRQRKVTLGLPALFAIVSAVGCADRHVAPRAPTTSEAIPEPSPALFATPAPTAPPATAPTAAPEESPPRGPAIDEQVVISATGAEKADKSPDGSVKVSFPRKDVAVTVDGWKMPPFMGLTSWATFSPAREGVAEAMVMGDLVLFEDEINPVMSVLFDNDVDVTALHNHFFFDAPKVYFMHIQGEGSVMGLGKGVRLALTKVAAIRKRTPKPLARSTAPAVPRKSSLDAPRIEAALNVKGAAADGMFKAVMGRETNAACGCPIGKAMGVNTWSAFAGTDDNAVVDGDFAVTEDELPRVLRSLRGGGIDVVAIHHHMVGESPRILFLHYWGRGKAVDLATTVRKALDMTAWEGKAALGPSDEPIR
jgi:Domain of Unknown Function (DUF1259)